MPALLLAAVLVAASGFAPAAATELAEARKLMDRAATLLDRARTGKETLAALGRAVSAHELALSAYRSALRRLATSEAALARDERREGKRLERMLAAIQSVGRAPRSALLAYPAGPVAAARGAGLLGDMAPLVDARIADYRLRIEDLRRVRAERDAARVAVRGALAELQELRASTMTALRRRREADLPGRAVLSEQARTAAAEAKNLKDLAELLDDAAGANDKVLVRFSEARGLIPLPVAGRMTAGSGDVDPWGRVAPGLTIEAPAYAQITAPWDGTVRYAGPLIDYGEVVVLEPESGYLLVIAGLSRVDRATGETVLAGERLGDLGGPIPASDDFLLEASSDRDEIGVEKLYIELRKNGAALDPAPWFDLTRKGG